MTNYLFLNKERRCTFCNARFRYRINLDRHMKKEHKTPIYSKKKASSVPTIRQKRQASDLVLPDFKQPARMNE